VQRDSSSPHPFYLEKQWFEPPTRVDASYKGSKVVRIPIPKVNINGKITLKWKKKNLKNQC
jgi:hypothetical protein